ncbi:MAG: thioredoxin family protein [bacterium]
MKRLTFSVASAVLMLAMLTGCPGPGPAATVPGPDTSLAAQDEICETLPATDSTAVAALPDSPPARPEPKPEPAPEPEPAPPPKPKVLPRMWDFGSDNCLPCVEMEKILTPLMTDYKGRVDIRIINVYQDRERTMQARIQIIPTQIFYDPEGRELFRHIGIYPRDSIVAKFREFGWE